MIDEHWMHPRCVASHKVGYADEAQAREALRECIELRRTKHTRRMERAVYLCEACWLWHLTRLAEEPLEAADLQPLVAALQHRWR